MVIEAPAGLLVGAAATWLWTKRVGVCDWNAGDVEEYRRGAEGPRPFCWRWLLPLVTASRPHLWRIITLVALAFSPLALLVYGVSKGLDIYERWFAVGMWICYAPLWERSTRIVHLGDALAILFSLFAAGLNGWWAVPYALVAGATRETAPVFAFLWSGNPYCLLGLLAIPWWRKGGEPHRHAHLFVNPWKTFSRQRWRAGFQLSYMLPFGGAIAGITNIYSWLVLAVAAVPLFRSIDTSRLLMWAFPTLLVCAVYNASGGALLAMLGWSIMMSSEWHP